MSLLGMVLMKAIVIAELDGLKCWKATRLRAKSTYTLGIIRSSG
ncbi:hypothetical protein PAAL109150_08430 [Paenibacillus alkaliterrae]